MHDLFEPMQIRTGMLSLPSRNANVRCKADAGNNVKGVVPYPSRFSACINQQRNF